MASAGNGDERGDTRERIISAAIHFFSSEGFKGTSIRQLGQAVGITSAGLYSHFPTKEAVLAAAVTRTYLNFLNAVAIPQDPPTENARLLGLCRRHMEFQIDDKTYASWCDVILNHNALDALLPSDIFALMLKAQKLYFSMVLAEVKSTRGDRDADPVVQTEAVLSLCDSVAGGPRQRLLDSSQFIDCYLTLIMRMLGSTRRS